MKELSIEEKVKRSIEGKAKAYDEALERAKIFKKHLLEINDIGYANEMDYIFPELKENEDEKIRKEIIAFLHSKNGYMTPNEDWDFHNRWIAWLEKQGEQKQDPCEHCDNVMLNCHNFPCIKKRAYTQGKSVLEVIKEDGENTYSETDGYKLVGPKFKVGDWVVNKFGDVWHIDSFDGKNYQVSDGKGNYNYFPISRQDKMRYWTIEDAKDGDVLCCESGWTCIFKALDNHTNTFSSYSFMDKAGWFCETGSEAHTLEKAFIKAYNGNIFPATKEQRDTLMRVMTDAGYTFDFEKKELKKIEQNPAWSEEDEKKRNLLIDILNVNHPNECFKVNPANTSNMEAMHTEELVSWLKSLRPQSTWKPSDEQIEALEHFIVYHNGSTNYAKDLEELRLQLKKLMEE
jgi:hypothetical protein